MTRSQSPFADPAPFAYARRDDVREVTLASGKTYRMSGDGAYRCTCGGEYCVRCIEQAEESERQYRAESWREGER